MVIGMIRHSQLITTFGPGALVNIEHDTVMILGLQDWPDSKEKGWFKRVDHPYLSQQLGVNHFKMPSSDKSRIPCISFPQWKICQSCHRLQKHSYRPRTNNKFNCKFCKTDLHLINAPFVQICDNGHIQEFSWDRWAHLNESIGDQSKMQCTKSDSDEPKLVFTSKDKGTGLANYIVKCLYCNAQRSMSGAVDKTKMKQLGFKKCFARQPWLRKNDKGCDEGIYGVQVSSSTVYYPFTVTSLLIPKWIHGVDDILNKKDGMIGDRIREDRKDGKSYDQIMEWHEKTFEPLLDKYPKNEIIKRLKMRFEPTNQEISTEGEAMEQEFDDFSDITKRNMQGKSPSIKLDIEPVEIDPSMKYHVDKLMKFHRLTAIQVLRGFTRGIPPDPYATETQIENKHPFRRIGLGHKKDHETGEYVPINWLPAVETRGEGIFFKFQESALRRWETDLAVKQRYEILLKNYAESIDAMNRSDKNNILQRFNSPRYILLHTFSHLLIREISYGAGYHEASLKERIYSTSKDKMRNGILIYTSSSSSDGSLGGLVRMGEPKKFYEMVEKTIRRSTSCSRDPICSEIKPMRIKEHGMYLGIQSSGSSCYSCTLLPETCCQNFNILLDRWMLQDPEYGFFREQIKKL